MRPPQITARVLTPTRFGVASAPPLAHYFAVFEITTARKWARRYKDRHDGPAKTMLWRLEERLALSLARARNEMLIDAAAGVLDLIAAVGVVAPTTCADSVAAQMAKTDAPPLLGELMRAGRFVALVLPSEGVGAGGAAQGRASTGSLATNG